MQCRRLTSEMPIKRTKERDCYLDWRFEIEIQKVLTRLSLLLEGFYIDVNDVYTESYWGQSMSNQFFMLQEIAKTDVFGPLLHLQSSFRGAPEPLHDCWICKLDFWHWIPNLVFPPRLGGFGHSEAIQTLCFKIALPSQARGF
ncbi:hypothetical protein AVEN_185119-1 [Araneus ventricosus]|uniref:Uncharacterized protein n=1 Tax=Araneus ventricosus TaxID=182803 RepID=A0A4Y2RQI0_ARAVE|nr:hypothetical protein AVEN_185119-1 [Araneus ventricosus]